ncbi:cytochrome P450 [Pseudoroseicyclus aestuarii]|uniref:Cytochrome P450 n=1 Tax=Pseudoroseicyclus aestuarii TaxID=1795041 RepID=A0A318T621_9RHOB|nr:cytochrome P450 [Pseudoroseicyclus aestuarii]PYE85864.1 cytochrome P450 [Pseudoroseicyclus aestuarii]
MQHLKQSPTDRAFVQDPYAFYDKARADGADLVFWAEMGMPCAVSHRAVSALLRDRRLGREAPPETAPEIPERLAPFYEVEAHSMLELEPPRHTRLRGLVLRAFTSRRIKALAPDIEALSHALIDGFPEGPFDLLEAFARPLPVTVIARLLGVEEARAPDLLAWSNAMVGMYQAGRSRAHEDAAVAATLAFRTFLDEAIAQKRRAPADDLISELIAAEEEGEKLSAEELTSTVILLLNAGHEATVHSIGNAVRALLAHDHRKVDAATVEELLRYDAPLHLFTRWVYEDVELFGQSFRRGDQVACLLAAANRDPAAYEAPERFDPARFKDKVPPQQGFGAGIHFCVGAPLARLELEIGLSALMQRCPDLALAEAPEYADSYGFHGLNRLMVTAG